MNTYMMQCLLDVIAMPNANYAFLFLHWDTALSGTHLLFASFVIQSDWPAEYLKGNYCHHTKEQWLKQSLEQKWNYNLNEISDLIYPNSLS